MYKTSLLVLGVLWLASCKKDNNSTRVETLLTIDSTKTPAAATLNTAFTARVRATGANLCYRFERMHVDSTAPREWAVRTIGSVQQGGACAQALYRVDTTVTIKPGLPGQHIVRYYNSGNSLFKADTVVVN
ncbi:hypothetical protein [Flaviaesturariibacter amylovorans]|uniref:Proteinase inhibitor I42 chagasin domain-containing protein n=1 Tax=Flaviaesturariibacter amylovorans TaxID=1084520 RepID=A0ABP8GPY6_9BACT